MDDCQTKALDMIAQKAKVIGLCAKGKKVIRTTCVQITFMRESFFK